MVFIRIGEMRLYQGLGRETDDQYYWPNSGGYNVSRWNEVLNFEPVSGWLYGGCFPQSPNPRTPARIHVEKLGAVKPEPDRAENVLVVWVATHRNKKNRVVGWYKNATVFREPQRLRHGTRPRKYYVRARSGDHCRLEPWERILDVPSALRAGKGKGMGHSNVWYADKALAFRRRVLKFIRDYEAGRALQPSAPTPRTQGGNRQHDPVERAKVEEAAMRAADDYFRRYGYRRSWVHRLNKGWDVTVRNKDRSVEMKVEVKGLSGTGLAIDLTPNEYKKARAFRDDYRVCIVTNARDPLRRRVRLFRYDRRARRWADKSGARLAEHPRESAYLIEDQRAD